MKSFAECPTTCNCALKDPDGRGQPARQQPIACFVVFAAVSVVQQYRSTVTHRYWTGRLLAHRCAAAVTPAAFRYFRNAIEEIVDADPRSSEQSGFKLSLPVSMGGAGSRGGGGGGSTGGSRSHDDGLQERPDSAVSVICLLYTSPSPRDRG